MLTFNEISTFEHENETVLENNESSQNRLTVYRID